MAYHQDWLMRQIEAISAMLKFIISGQKTAVASLSENETTVSGGNNLYLRLKMLTEQGKLCEAENLLFDVLDDADPDVLNAAVGFYTDLNQLSDDELEQCNFSRNEIKDGLDEICKRYGINYF